MSPAGSSRGGFALLFVLSAVFSEAGFAGFCGRQVFRTVANAHRYTVESVVFPGRMTSKRKINRHFRRIGGEGLFLVEKWLGLDGKTYAQGLANLASALEGAQGRLPRVGKVYSIVITEERDIIVINRLMTGGPSIHVPYDFPAESIVQEMSTTLLEHVIGKKIRHSWVTIKNKGLSAERYIEAMEGFYLIHRDTPLPREIREVESIVFVKKGGIRLRRNSLDRNELVVGAGAVQTKESAVLPSAGGSSELEKMNDEVFALYNESLREGDTAELLLPGAADQGREELARRGRDVPGR